MQSKACSAPTTGMETRACSSVWNAKLWQATGAHQRRPAIPPARTGAPPNSAWYHAEAGQQIEMFPALRENSPSFKYLQGHSSTLRWTIACPWHGLTTTLRLHSSTMLGACLPQPHGAIYSQRRASGSWRSDDTVTM
jgi:hypothetical protein